MGRGPESRTFVVFGIGFGQLVGLLRTIGIQRTIDLNSHLKAVLALRSSLMEFFGFASRSPIFHLVFCDR